MSAPGQIGLYFYLPTKMFETTYRAALLLEKKSFIEVSKFSNEYHSDMSDMANGNRGC
jgi:hypothetical protein